MNESTTTPLADPTLATSPTTHANGAPLRLVIAAGGTGGHIFPAIATLDALRAHGPVDVTWIGGRRSFEERLAQENNILFKAIPVGKLRRYIAWQTVPDAARIPAGIVRAWWLLRRLRPDVVLSTGGYASVPTIVAARLRRIRSLTHEQTVTLGLATKINARFVDVVALSWPSSQASLGAPRGRIMITGNPLRAAITTGDAQRAVEGFALPAERPLLYATGGIQGATSINLSILGNLPDLLPEVSIIHQCGPYSGRDDAEALRTAAAAHADSAEGRYVQRELVGAEVGDILAAATLVVARAGAGTVAELVATGTPSILVPLPGAEEQRRNAQMLAEAGGAIIVPDEEMTAERLRTMVSGLLHDPDTLARMASGARSLAQADPAARLAAAVRDLANRNGA